MNISAKERLLISNLIASCDELISGKFIIADKKVRKILENITQSDVMYGLVGDCMANFEKSIEFSKALVKLPTKQGYVEVPDDEAKLIPLVFCILVDLDTGKLDFRNFLKTYFSDKEQSAFIMFGQQLIKPFREAFSVLFDIDDSRLTAVKTEAVFEEERGSDEQPTPNYDEEEKEDTYEVIIRIAEEMKANIRQGKKNQLLEDLDFIIDALKAAAENRDLQAVNALVLAINYIGKKIRSLKFLMKELDERILDFYKD